MQTQLLQLRWQPPTNTSRHWHCGGIDLVHMHMSQHGHGFFFPTSIPSPSHTPTHTDVDQKSSNGAAASMYHYHEKKEEVCGKHLGSAAGGQGSLGIGHCRSSPPEAPRPGGPQQGKCSSSSRHQELLQTLRRSLG